MKPVVSWILKKTLLVFVAAIVGLVVWTAGALHYVYSSGERAGYVQKFSKRGWLFKTWEGELAMVNLPGAMPEVFHFTVRNKDVVGKIESSMGQRVVITYNQHRGIPSRIFGETQYFLSNVRLVEDAQVPPTFPAK